MKEYAINFEGRSNAVNINQLRGTALLELFSDYNGQIIDMHGLVATLNNNGFQVDKIINNPNNTVYRIQSNHKNMVLSLSISKDLKYQQKNKDIYLRTINVLKAMNKNATVVNNNIINITNKDGKKLQDAYKPNLQLIKGTKYNKSIKKLLKTKKGKIVLCTLIVVAIVTGFVVYAVNDTIEYNSFMEYYRNESGSYQDNAPTFDERGFYEAQKKGEVVDENPNGELERMIMEYNRGKYKGEQNIQNVR